METILAWSVLGLCLLASVVLVALVLWQRGSGGGLTGLFGGSVQQSGVTSATAGRNLRVLTTATGVVWAAAALAYGLLVPVLG